MLSHLFKLMWNKRRANGLLFLEILLAFVVLFGVYGFAFYNLERYNSPLGFQTVDMLGVAIDIDDDIDSLAIAPLQERIKRDIRNLDGVADVTFLGFVNPFGGNTWGYGGDDNGFDAHVTLSFVDEDFARTLNMQMRDGRWFEPGDENEKYSPIVVNGAFWDDFYPDAETIVDTLFILAEEQRKIIGVVDHYKYHSNFEEPYPHVFFPPHSGMIELGDYQQLIVRTEPGRMADVEEPLYKLLVNATKNPDVVSWSIEEDRVKSNRSVVIPLVIMIIISGFLLINIALGLFGVLFTQINHRRAEIGLRKAMGATPGEVTAQFVSEVLLVTAAGLLVGTFFAIQVPLLELLPIPGKYFYFGIGASIVTILIIVTICALLPSRQAAGLHPAHVLHEE
jgi:putative ABC transport system permease protein